MNKLYKFFFPAICLIVIFLLSYISVNNLLDGILRFIVYVSTLLILVYFGKKVYIRRQ